jgi:anti-sigma factor RsiW
MNCTELRAAICDYVERRLAGPAREAFERHRAACAACEALMRDVLALPCRDFVQFLDDYCEERLPAEQRAVFERHMQICPPCVVYLESYRSTIDLEQRAWVERAEVPEELVRAILRARRQG